MNTNAQATCISFKTIGFSSGVANLQLSSSMQLFARFYAALTFILKCMFLKYIDFT